jgi:8-oxo-dGTP pyrophosphatase MutT (NUDIX family)
LQFDEGGIAAEIIGKTREAISARVTRCFVAFVFEEHTELPGGRLEPGEAPMTCLVREFAEELGAAVVVASIIDCWVYEVLPQCEVVIITYGVQHCDEEELRVSDEHRRFGLFTLHEIEALPMPEGYRRSIRAWFAQPDQHR